MKFTPVRAVAVLLVALLVLGAAGLAVSATLSDDDPTDASTPTTAASATPTPTPQSGSTEPPEPDLETFYSQTLDWQSCRDGFVCATLTVPLDYQQPDGDTIDLALLKDSADDPGARIGSLVVNPGGPGAAGTDYAAAGSDTWGQALLDHFDLVGFDPRGTGSSEPVDCLSDDDLDAYLASDPDPDTPAEVDGFSEVIDAFGAGCIAKSGALASHVSTVEAARDMDVLRAALGESTMLYVGASYGTKLGATYAEYFPDKVGRLVLDGAIDPSLDYAASIRSQATGFETALDAYVQNCVDQGDCFLGETAEAATGRIVDLLEQLDAEPLPTNTDRDLTEGLGLFGIIVTLYNRDYWSYLDQGLETALDGDGSTLLILSDAYTERDQGGGYLGNLMEALPVINCLDDPSFTPVADVPAQVPSMLEASPTFGRVFAWSLAGCSGFTARSDEKPRPIKAAGAAPIVVIGTTRDPATPYEQAVALAEQLDSGVLVSRDGDGHTGYMSGNDCVDTAVEDYLVDGTVPEDGLSC